MQQHPIDDEDQASAPGEGDEIMEEPEDQEDGYSSVYPAFPHLSLTMRFLAASSTPTSTLTWISWFCSLPGHEYFCEVTEEFIEDDFNLTGLNNMVPFWKEAMEMVLDVDPGVDRNRFYRVYTCNDLPMALSDEDESKIPDVSIVESSAEMLYGLVHQRFILTRAGLQAMASLGQT